MTEYSELVTAKNSLIESLGDKANEYMQHMKLWFQMKWTKNEFDSEVRKVMNADQVRLHNNLLIQLFKISDSLSSSPASPLTTVPATEFEPAKRTRSSSNKRKSPHGPSTYQSTSDDVPLLRGGEPQPVRYAAQELFLPDETFLYGRLLHCAWEHELDAAETAAAQLLSVAVQHFMKNIMTAVLSQRTGYKIREGKFVYGLGSPVPNPWLRSMSKLNDPEPLTRGSIAELEGGMHMIRPSVPQLEQQVAYSIACAKNSVPCASLTVPDIINGLKAHRSAIQSHTVFSFNMERLLLANSHPSWDEIE